MSTAPAITHRAGVSEAPMTKSYWCTIAGGTPLARGSLSNCVVAAVANLQTSRAAVYLRDSQGIFGIITKRDGILEYEWSNSRGEQLDPQIAPLLS